MAHDEGLAQRIRERLCDVPDLTEKTMFGGVGFMIRGNMACGVHKDKLVVRVGPERDAEARSMPYALPFDITGRPMQGWVMVTADGYEADEDLERWVQWGVEFALTLPAK